MSATPHARPALCVAGPTASGKTALAIALARRLPADILSVDSVMVYRGLDIGSAKPDAATLSLAPHRLIDIEDPVNSYSAARFRTDARREMAAIHAAGRLPLLVGGTMLYFQALQRGLDAMPAANPALRARLSAERRQLGNAGLHAALAKIDPQAAARIHPNDPQRVQRALEVHALSGRSHTELTATERRTNIATAGLRWFNVVLLPGDRSRLHAVIEQRLQAMLAAGLVAEVERLWSRPELHAQPPPPALRAVGYRQVWEYLEGLTDHATMVQRALSATRQFAKRQHTWLRNRPLRGATLVLDSQASTCELAQTVIKALTEQRFFAVTSRKV